MTPKHNIFAGFRANCEHTSSKAVFFNTLGIKIEVVVAGSLNAVKGHYGSPEITWFQISHISHTAVL